MCSIYIKENMRRLLSGALVAGTVAIGSLMQAIPAEAASFTYNLSCVISGNLGSDSFSGGDGCTDVNASFGTLTLSDTANSGEVQLSLDLAGTVNKILGISLNYLGSATNFDISASSIELDPNDIKADGYPGFFDLAIPENGNIGDTDTFTALITATGLTASQLNATDTLNQIFAAIHIGNYGGSPGVAGGDSIWVGAKPSTSIPTPALIPGLIGMGVAAVRKKKRAEEFETVTES